MNVDQTVAEVGRGASALPALYYHDHFVELLEFVEAHYAHALCVEHVDFIRAFRRLSLDSQCLFVRLANRKGQLFRRSRLRYPEISNIDSSLDELAANGLVRPPGQEDLPALLRLSTRAELLDALLPGMAGISRSLRKPDYIALARDYPDADGLLQRLARHPVFVQGQSSAVAYLLFLYFGRLPDGLSRFTMRDLGLVETQSFASDFEPRFQSREEALQSFYFASRRQQLVEARDNADIADLLREVSVWPAAAYASSSRQRNALAYSLGRKAERAGQRNEARIAYAAGDSAKCREREIRVLLASGRLGEARKILDALDSETGASGEWQFVTDLLQRRFGGKRTCQRTDLLREAGVIDLDDSFLGAPERGAAEWFRARGADAWQVENSLWRTLFGLLFWDQLFGASATALHSPFEWRPDSLSDGRFYARHRNRIEARLRQLDHPGAALKSLLTAGTRHYGTANGVFRWRRETLDAVFALLRAVAPSRLAPPLRAMAQRFSDTCHGYPDLLVIDSDGVRFVEVKAEGDLLRPNQVARLQELRLAGLEADVLRARYVIDPAQPYVVVDVETTGGRSDSHRITEFAAVRVANGKVIDRFESLVNPHRQIPPAISRLTGITQAMVAQAPPFADIADRVDHFTRDAVFVAHNVGFDYRFVRSEFRRLGRSFLRPRLCTCSSMRRYYPGLPRYSLDALCREFRIPLKTHHRALCDAEAATELLFLVNDKRAAERNVASAVDAQGVNSR